MQSIGSSVKVGDATFLKELFTRLTVFFVVVILVVSHFGFEGWILVMVGPVPGRLLLLK